MIQSPPHRVPIKSAKCIIKSPNVDYCYRTLPDERIFSNYTFLGLLIELDFTDRGEIRQISPLGGGGGGVSPQVCLLVTVLMVLYKSVAS